MPRGVQGANMDRRGTKPCKRWVTAFQGVGKKDFKDWGKKLDRRGRGGEKGIPYPKKSHTA